MTNFEKLVYYAESQHVSGILANAISGYSNLDVKCLSWSNNIIKEYKRKLRYFKQEMHSISHLFNERNIKYYFLKGVDYANRLYSEESERYMTDIDLMVDADSLWEANDLLKSIGYQQEIPFINRKLYMRKDKFEYIPMSDKEIKEIYEVKDIKEIYEVLIHRSSDPLAVIKTVENEIVDEIHIDLHQNRNFHVLNINKLCDNAIELPYINLPGSYRAFIDTDIIIFAAWHLYHHLVEQVPDEGLLFIRNSHLKQASDFWRAFKRFYIEKDESERELMSRVVETESANLVLYAVDKIVALFQYIDEPVPIELNMVKTTLLKLCDTNKLSRILENEWNYSGKVFNFWDWILNSRSKMEEIKKLIIEKRQKGEYNITAEFGDSCEPHVVSISEPEYISGSDRLKSFTNRDDRIDLHYPSLKFAVHWDFDGLCFDFISNDNLELQLRLSRSTSDDYSAFVYFIIRLHDNSINVHLNNHDELSENDIKEVLKCEYMDDKNQYRLHISKDILPFDMRKGDTFVMRILFESIILDRFFPDSSENYHPKFSWPSGIAKCGEVLLN